ncbi:MAG TPA: methyltransferase domain-containing protein [Gammaproteobacteria bacterium]|nr:methyltransferase domain-containing protein [Gammaproteobacteria bacterium]
MAVGLRNEEDQVALWNGAAGATWVEAQEPLDRLFKPFEDLLVESVAAKGARHVLDVGCGTGATTLAIARALGVRGSCVGVDVSEPMLALARARAERERVPAEFVLADAQTHAFGAAAFDLIVSRFGVMFFEDSARAFANLRRAALPGGELDLIAWRSAAENPFMTAAERAAAPFLPNIPPRRTDGPGQFAFADSRRVSATLERGGWAGVDVRPLDVACSFAKSDLVDYVTRIGPLGRALRSTDERTRAEVTEVVLRAFEPYVRGADVRFDAACWRIGARAA